MLTEALVVGGYVGLEPPPAALGRSESLVARRDPKPLVQRDACTEHRGRRTHRDRPPRTRSLWDTREHERRH
jgi:hypothetical protein